jgi:hypothetical protein
MQRAVVNISKYERKKVKEFAHRRSFSTDTENSEDFFNILQPKRYWKINNPKPLFDQFAKRLNITKPSDWYKVSRQDLMDDEVGLVINNVFKGSLNKGILRDQLIISVDSL